MLKPNVKDEIERKIQIKKINKKIESNKLINYEINF
jgi:hypothetical protein